MAPSDDQIKCQWRAFCTINGWDATFRASDLGRWLYFLWVGVHDVERDWARECEELWQEGVQEVERNYWVACFR